MKDDYVSSMDSLLIFAFFIILVFVVRKRKDQDGI